MEEEEKYGHTDTALLDGYCHKYNDMEEEEKYGHTDTALVDGYCHKNNEDN